LQHFRATAECLDAILKDIIKPIGSLAPLTLFIISNASIIRRAACKRSPSRCAFHHFAPTIDRVRSMVAANFAAELGRLPGDNRVDLNGFNIFTRDVRSLATPLSVSDPVQEPLSLIKRFKRLKNILSQFFALTNYAAAVRPISGSARTAIMSCSPHLTVSHSARASLAQTSPQQFANS
jgi:hypothetical protein